MKLCALRNYCTECPSYTSTEAQNCDLARISHRTLVLDCHLSDTVLGLTGLVQKQVFTFQSKLNQNLGCLGYSATRIQKTGSSVLLTLLLSSTNTFTKCPPLYFPSPQEQNENSEAVAQSRFSTSNCEISFSPLDLKDLPLDCSQFLLSRSKSKKYSLPSVAVFINH